MISKAGTLLERSIIDRSVGQGERLVFEAPPVLTSPLAQDAESRRPIATEGDVLDTITACPPLTTAERATFDALVANAKKEIQSEAEKVRAAYVEERAEEMVERTGMSKEAAIQVIESTREGVLLSDVELIFSDKNLGRCTVGDVLDDPERFNKKALADLIEGPDYGRTTAMVLLRRDGTPWINSFAHGGVSYSLEREETAKDAGRKIELGSAEPTYPATNSRGVEEARQTLEQHIDAFIGTAATWNEDQASDSLFIQHWIRETDNQPPVHAIRASTGIGKTQGFAARLAQHRQTTDDKRPLLYLVPTHRLGEDTAEHFEKENLTARVYRGREAPDPKLLKEGLPKREQVKMCLNLEQVKVATACGQDVNSACCKNKEQQCKFYNDCAYQRQFEGERPDVWLAAHNMLFHPQKLFNDVAGIVIDETYYKHGIRGLDASKHEEEDKSFTLDDFVVKEGGDFAAPEYYDYHSGRGYLVDILREHPLGGLQRDLLVGKMTPEECTKYHGLEWQTVNSVQIVPQMTDGELSLITEKVPAIRRAKFMAGVWRGLRELLQMPEGTVSGRLVLEKKAGKLVLRSRGVREIMKAREVPTLILDATLPDVSILRMWHPQVEVVADIEVKMPPNVHIRQVLGAPVSQRKLWGTEKKKAVGRNRDLIRRYIVQKWLETDRQSMLVICQMDVEHWLKEAGLPDGIAVEHFNAISGLDQYKHVRSLILIGRTIAPPLQVEAVVGALTGVQPAKVVGTAAAGKKPDPWYDRVTRGIRMADGSGIAVEADQHPDPIAEAVRWQICEAELMQALGRARGVNRTAETPLNVDIWANVVVPITVNEVSLWEEPRETVEMEVEGITLTTPKDMAKAWPSVWPNRDAAKYALKKITAAWRGRAEGKIPRVYYTLEKLPLAILYTTAFTKFRRAAAFFDPHILPNPRPWLEKRLGALASLFHLLRNGEIASLAPKVGVTVDDRLVTVLPATLPGNPG